MSIMQSLFIGKTPVILDFASSSVATATTSATKTTSTSIGTASADRWVMVLVQWPIRGSGGFGPIASLSTATINGVSASIGYNFANTQISVGTAVFYALVTSGTGAVTITANLTNVTNNNPTRFIVYTVTGRDTLSYTANNNSAFATATTLSTSLACPTNGFNLNMWTTVATAPTSPTWSGTPSTPTLQNATSDSFNYASVYDGTSSAGVTVGATFTQSNSIYCKLTSSSWTYT
jgi:hypothetical protein